MLKNYLKTAWRNLLKNKFYSGINIAGLTAGLAIGILILLWVQDELSFDGFHKQTANIYRLELFGGTGSSRQIWSVGVAPIGPLVKKQLPEVKDAVRITGNYNFSLYKYKDKVFGDNTAAFTDPSFFSVFDFPLIKGDPARPFADNNSVVITQKTAQKFFGDENPIGKIIIADNKANFTVSGVIGNFPDNSSIKYDMLMPMSYHINEMLVDNHVDMNTNFSFFAYQTYLLLKPGISLKNLSVKIRQVHLNHKPDDTDAEYLLLPLSKMHLYNADLTDKGITTVRIFIVIALLILVIACINYVNLSTARSMLRSKEISMRKIIGAAKSHLFMQFIVETTLLFLLATVLAVGLIFILMPLFNQISGKQLAFNLADYQVWLVILATITGTLAASSIYPALLLSSFEPLKALKGKISAGIGDVMFRKILVVTQFVFSIVLIVGTIIITSQLNFIRSKDLGYDKANVFSFWMRDMGSHYDAVRAELLKQPGIQDVTRSNQNIVRYGGISGDNDWDGKAPNSTFIIHPIIIDKDFIPFFKMKLVKGASFTGAISDSANYILNEAAIKEMGLKDPVGKRFRMGQINGKIIGVVKDFHFESMKEKIAPSVFWYSPKYLSTIYIKTTGKNAAMAIKAAEKQFKQYNGQYPFGYAFLDDMFNDLYKGEQTEGKLFNYFAGIAILISCLGLLGLAAYTAQVRTREIGVRKVLGASVSRIVGLLAQDFIKLVFIAILIATPVAWFAMDKWLQAYAYRTALHWWVFALAGIIAVMIAFITISFQSIKAALTNPIKSLRSE
jgi:putative ABC transport system permease protein